MSLKISWDKKPFAKALIYGKFSWKRSERMRDTFGKTQKQAQSE